MILVRIRFWFKIWVFWDFRILDGLSQWILIPGVTYWSRSVLTDGSDAQNQKYYSGRICLVQLILCFLYSIRHVETRSQGGFARNKPVCRRRVSKSDSILWNLMKSASNPLWTLVYRGTDHWNLSILRAHRYHLEIKKRIFIKIPLDKVFLHLLIRL